MEYTLENQFLKAIINTHGAELSSVKDQNTGTEYLWQADPTVWARHAPILFPIVGRLNNDTYTYQGKSYHMTQHGFARDSEFQIEHSTDNSVTLLLFSNAATLKMYPFKFQLRVSYQLVNNLLTVSFNVKNMTDGEMIFGIGGHPGFNLQLDEDVQKNNYFFSFEPSKSRVRIPLVGPYIDIDKRTLAPTDTLIEVSDTLFKDDALIYALNSQTKISLRNDKNDYHINVMLDQTPFVGLWSPYPTTSDFVCIEPWWGIADELDSSGTFEEKVGMNKLTAGQEFNSQFRVAFHDKKID
ncbi:galactose mutarotase-like protein [Amylolactobacillus amylotrophicus DSM 20534]|uniref:Aldose epimerase n=3 Tax=Amylolactobacillus TaxID=2767876 RepID=A0A1L6XDZ9_9LACO|nr:MULTISPECIES: aldose 1-epimerase family protein [Amylolactobacillus]APT19189.1 aldose epimerase [Amylolactobacillus amylophilus DSM 20533 = JCM 1125]KRK38537.1 galactose mutarotase-like protein [Amylolactobacillus amylotrophicus DSM 20534]KRM42820.1 galactose mutarotase-like protein [Amylolactobacillus amylophilus DSM 20533 = JCM 1125]GED79683.1 aldose 1-epimerase [Amylolactobacillus amylophilus]